jgi:hypothetical protein
MKIKHLTFILVIATAFLLVACNGSQNSTPTPEVPTATLTPDPCLPGNIEAEVQKVHSHMREFDDASMLAANEPREQLSDAIANLQRIRRESEDQPIPACLATLKTYQIAHMNTVINTLIAFMGGSDQDIVNQGINTARAQHDMYTMELARVMGITPVPIESLITPSATGEAIATATP